jgi:hypothetical protein
MMRNTATRVRRWPGWLRWPCLALLSWPAFGAPSPPERLEWHGRIYDLAGAPLEQRYPGGQGRPRFQASAGEAGTERGYAGRWRLEDDRLYLVDIDAQLCDVHTTKQAACRRATLADLFGIAPGRTVFAEWFNGVLVLSPSRTPPSPQGEADEPTYRITLKAGKVTRIEAVGGRRREGR